MTAAPVAVPRPALPADELYGRLLATAAAEALEASTSPVEVPRAGGHPRARIRIEDGRTEPMPLDAWLGPVTRADQVVIDQAAGPVLDVGCGPGRLLAALAARRVDALGVDLSPMAVRLARHRGGRAVTGSVFDDVPGAGSWATALLLDGNIGIGGDPVALLRRVGALLAPGGRVAVEVEPPGAPTRRERIRIEAAGTVSDWFPWARVGADGIDGLATSADLRVARVEAADDRWFAWLQDR